MTARKSDLIDFIIIIKHRTERAALVFDGDIKTWIPLSQCELSSNLDGTHTLTMPEWLAQEKGLI